MLTKANGRGVQSLDSSMTSDLVPTALSRLKHQKDTKRCTSLLVVLLCFVQIWGILVIIFFVIK